MYEAVDSRTGRRVAVKIIAAEHVSSREAVERFRQEGRLASALEHPRCVYVLSADEDDAGRPYIVMELMPGATLQSLVEQRGALPLEEALLRILDVIEGLEQAHASGVVHRDVKPSNCFLDAGGRVKIGDFGLSKSLSSDPGLTRSGSFIGTPLYASPEQIKGDPVDQRTDVYSVCATLYFLLCGAPPFQARDAAATLARIVSEPPPPLQALRADLPASLEAVIFRGMDRDPARRWASLEELRHALVPFLTSWHSIGSIGWRLVAFALDFVLCTLMLGLSVGLFIGAMLAVLNQVGSGWAAGLEGFLAGSPVLFNVLEQGAFLAYFTFLEGVGGASLGKRLCRLRVVSIQGGPCGVGRAFVRSLVFFALTALPMQATSFVFGSKAGEWMGIDEALQSILLAGTTTLVAGPIVLVLLASTMRASNGYRGPHELASRTRVVQQPLRRGRRLSRLRRLIRHSTITTPRPEGVPEFVGAYRIQAALAWDEDRRVVLGEDRSLDRLVWIVFRTPDTPAPTPARQELARASRPRWLTGGVADGRPWDAYSAPVGCSLADLAGRGLPWRDVLPLLEDLAEELERAVAEGTLPESLSVDQVWVQPDGHAVLVDALAPTRPLAGLRTPERRALDLIQDALVLALEGERWDRRTTPVTVDAPLPASASRFLERVLDPDHPIPSLAEVRAGLRLLRDQPTEVTRMRRALHLVLSSAPKTPLIVLMFLWDAFDQHFDVHNLSTMPSFERILFGVITGGIALSIVWSALTRGGFTLRLAGLRLVGRNNQPATRIQCAWRATLIWLPLCILLLVAPFYVERTLRLWCWWAAVGLLPLYIVSTLREPIQGLHDRLARTYLVPL